MIVRIRFGRGRLVTRRKGKNGKAALLLASLLSLVAISFAALGFWRLGEDLGVAGDFVFRTGFLSHWQVWIAAAACHSIRLLAAHPILQDWRGIKTEENATTQAPVEKVSARV